MSRALICYVGDCPNELHYVAPRLPLCSFVVPVRGTKDRYVSVWNDDDVDYEDRGFDSPVQRTVHDGRVIAKQLLFSSAIPGMDNRERGFFIAEGNEPTEAELRAAEKARDEHRRHLIDTARFRYNKDRHSRNITDEAFWAAERMGLQEEWMSLSSNPCPACGVAAPHAAAVCGRCGCILDEKKWAELKFVPTVGATPAPNAGKAVAQGQR